MLALLLLRLLSVLLPCSLAVAPPLPGWDRYDVDPAMKVLSDRINFAFGRAKAKEDTDNNAFVEIETPSGRVRVPKGFYHYSDSERVMDGNWGIPRQGEWLRARGDWKDSRTDYDGVNFRMPNMQPFNMQFISERTTEKGFSNVVEDSPREALRVARRICREKSEADCERALTRYYEMRVDEIVEERAPLQQQLMRLTDVASTSQLHDREARGLGVVLGLPGSDPLYIGGRLDQNRNTRNRWRFSPPQ